MPTPILQQMLGQGGTMEFVDAAVTGENFDFIVVNTAATFTTLTGTGGENNVGQVRICGHRHQRKERRQDYGRHSKRR
jgi:hypothetical protein